MFAGLDKDGKNEAFKREDLLEDFLRTFKEQCRLAAEITQPLLLMPFGHGDAKIYGIAIGGVRKPNALRLRTHDIEQCLRGFEVDLTILLT